MTDLEYDILDELYFVISYEELIQQVDMAESDLRKGIFELFSKGWVRVFSDPDETLDYENLTEELLSTGYLLASKAGLKAHNSA